MNLFVVGRGHYYKINYLLKKKLASAFSRHNYLENDLEHPKTTDAKLSVRQADVR
jgi:hypothetical protein